MASLTTGTPSSTTSTSGLPTYLQPYATQNMANMWNLSQTPYQAFPGQQNANFTGLQNQSFQEAGQLGPSQQTAQASQAANQATNNLLGTNYNGMQAGYQSVSAPQLTNYQMQGPGNVYTQGFNNQAAAQLMNPYIQQSLDPQIQLLQQQQGMQASQNAAQATQAGAFGGSRFGIQQGLQNQANQLAQSNLVGNAYNTAYTNAQNQFNTQQQLGLQAQTANQNARLATGEQNLAAALGVQSLGAQQGLAAQQANQQAGLTAQQANINQQQFGASLGQAANQAAISGANTLGQLGQNAYAQNVGTIGLQNTLGGQQQQYQQGLLNTQYQNYVNQLNYPYQQAAFMQNAINGYPVNSSTSTTQPGSPSALQNATSAAVGAYGLSQAFPSAWNSFTSWLGGNSSSDGSGGSSLGDAISKIFSADGGLMKSYKKGGTVKGYADGSLTSISSALNPLPTNNKSTLEKAIEDAQARGDTETAAALQSELTLQGYIGGQSAQLGQVATPGAPQAGSYGVNPNTKPQQTMPTVGHVGAQGAPSASGSTSGLPSIEDVLKFKQMTNEAKIANSLPSTQSIAADASNVPGIGSSSDNFWGTNSGQGLSIPQSAQGGLQYIPLSDSVLPTVSKKRGGITDVAGYAGDEASLAELDSPVETFKSPEAKEAMMAKSISDAASASAAPQASFIVPPPQPAMQAPASMGPGPGPSNAPMPAPAPTAAPNAPAPMLANSKPQALQQGIQGLSAAVAAPTNYASLMTQDQQAAMRQQLAAEHAAAAGQEPYTAAQQALAAKIAGHPDEDKRAMGLAALMAIPGILSGNQAGRGIAQGLGDYAKSVMQLKADQEKRDQSEVAMNLHLSEAQRADKLGHWAYGMQGTKDYVKEGHEVDALNEKILKDKAEMAKWEALAGKADKTGGAGHITSAEVTLQNQKDIMYAMQHPEDKEAQAKANAIISLAQTKQVLPTEASKDINAAKISDLDRKAAEDEFNKLGKDFMGGSRAEELATKKKFLTEAGGDAALARENYVRYKLKLREGTPDSRPSNLGRTKTTPEAQPYKPTSAPPVQLLKEGVHTTFKNGEVWTLQNGKPVKVNQ